MMRISKKKIKASDFDKVFDKGGGVEYLDLKSSRVHHPIQRVNIDIPGEILEKVDREASRVGVPRTSLIKLWIAERIDHLKAC